MKYVSCILMFFVFVLKSQNDLNDSIVSYVQKNGKTLAPSYQSVVCTDFVIKILDHYTKLSKTEKKRIQIITDQSINKLIFNASEIPNGVCYAITSHGKGKYINAKHAKSGDFIQFWNKILGFYTWGHCGILDHIDFEKNQIYMYSSHPKTDGYGLHCFTLPDYIVFARYLP